MASVVFSCQKSTITKKTTWWSYSLLLWLVFWKVNHNMKNNYTLAIAPTISSWTQENFNVILDYIWIGSGLYGQLNWHSSKKECLEVGKGENAWLHVETSFHIEVTMHLWQYLNRSSVESSFASHLFIIMFIFKSMIIIFFKNLLKRFVKTLTWFDILEKSFEDYIEFSLT